MRLLGDEWLAGEYHRNSYELGWRRVDGLKWSATTHRVAYHGQWCPVYSDSELDWSKSRCCWRPSPRSGDATSR